MTIGFIHAESLTKGTDGSKNIEIISVSITYESASFRDRAMSAPSLVQKYYNNSSNDCDNSVNH
jgi:hypothetical protein